MNKIICVGNIRNTGLSSLFVGSVYGWGGCSPSIVSRIYKSPYLILVKESNEQGKSDRNDKEVWEQV